MGSCPLDILLVKANPVALSTPFDFAREILYVDNHLLVARKPAGMLVQGDVTGDVSLLDHGKAWLKAEFAKPGEVFLGLVHRLDRPVSGVIVFARTSKAASRLSEQFRTRSVRKVYWAIVEGRMDGQGELYDRILREGPRARVLPAGASEGDEARLSWRSLASEPEASWIEVDLHTGRHHQIRAQLAAAGHPILGDLRYGATMPFPRRAVALHARSLAFEHPTLREPLTFTAEPEAHWPSRFRLPPGA